MSNIKNWIPKYFELGGVEFNTTFVENVQNGKNYGLSSMANGLVQLQKNIQGIEISNTQLQSTFFHELAHQLLDSIGEEELSGNEKFVQNLGNAVFEFLRTAKWIRLEEFKHNVYKDPDPSIPFLQ